MEIRYLERKIDEYWDSKLPLLIKYMDKQYDLSVFLKNNQPKDLKLYYRNLITNNKTINNEHNTNSASH